MLDAHSFHQLSSVLRTRHLGIDCSGGHLSTRQAFDTLFIFRLNREKQTAVEVATLIKLIHIVGQTILAFRSKIKQRYKCALINMREIFVDIGKQALARLNEVLT